MQWLDRLRESRAQKKRLKKQKDAAREKQRRARRQQKLADRARKRQSKQLLPSAKRKGRVALCLGGGGARGFAHIGALQAFAEAGVEFDLCVGTSVGSIVGALWAAGIAPSAMLEYGANINMKDIRKGAIWRPDDSLKIGKIVRDLVGDITFDQLKKPFYAVAVDLVTGKEVIIDSGPVYLATAASATVPLFFRPLVIGEQHLVDGGLLNNIPADVCRMLGADYVITIDVNPTRGGCTSELGLVSVLKATFNIMGTNASYQGLINSDILIACDTGKFKSTEKEGYDEMYEVGYRAAKEKIEDIKRLIYS